MPTPGMIATGMSTCRVAFASSALSLSVVIALALATTADAHAARAAATVESAEFTVVGTNGYRLRFSGTIDGSESRVAVTATARQGEVLEMSASYQGPPSDPAAKGVMRGTLDDLGAVNMTFEAGPRKTRSLGRGCGKATIVSGTFRGFVAFRGEGGYTQASATQVAGRVIRQPSLMGDVCGGRSVGKRSVFLSTFRRSGTGHTSFSATRFERPRRTYYAVRVTEDRGPLGITRRLYWSPARGPLTTNRRLTRAKMTPGGPFSGSAKLRKRRWTGTLAVDLPGLPAHGLVKPKPDAVRLASGRSFVLCSLTIDAIC